MNGDRPGPGMAMDLALEGEEGGWIVTYADLITLLLVFFILLFSISSLDVEKFKRLAMEMQKSFGRPVAEMAAEGEPDTGVGPDYFSSEPPDVDVPLELREEVRIKLREQLRPEVREEVRDDVREEVREELKEEMRDDVRRELTADLRENPDERLLADVQDFVKKSKYGNHIIITEGRNKLTVTVEGQLFFGSGEASLYTDAMPVIDQIVGIIQNHPEYRVNIKGHTDDNPISTVQFPSNWELSATRATTVLRYLVDKGVSPDRLTATGYGDVIPLVPNDSPENRARNRRVEFVLEKQKQD